MSASLCTLAARALPPDELEAFHSLNGPGPIYGMFWRGFGAKKTNKSLLVRERRRLADLAAGSIVAAFSDQPVGGLHEHARWYGLARAGERLLGPGPVVLLDLALYIDDSLAEAERMGRHGTELLVWRVGCACRDQNHEIDPSRLNKFTGLSFVISKMAESPQEQIPYPVFDKLKRHIHWGNQAPISEFMYRFTRSLPCRAFCLTLSIDGAHDSICPDVFHTVDDTAHRIALWVQTSFLLKRPFKPGTVPLCNIWTHDGKAALTPMVPFTALPLAMRTSIQAFDGEGAQVLVSYLDALDKPVCITLQVWRTYFQ